MCRQEKGAVALVFLVGSIVVGLSLIAWFLYFWFAETPALLIEGKPATEATASEPAFSEKTNMPGDSPDKHLVSKQLPANPTAEHAAKVAGFELSQIAAVPWTDAEFKRLSKLLKLNPEVVQQLALEYRINTDSDKMQRLAMLLGQFDNAIITDVGVELALSGDPGSQKSGLLLLGWQQPRNARARKTVADLISVESNPQVLVSALNAMAKPAHINRAEQMDLLDRFSRLANNTDPLVRSHSMTIISSWARDVNMNPVLLQGLDDKDPHVRETATFAFLKTRHLSDDVKYSLLAKSEDSNERKSTREAALYALKRFDLSADEKQRYDDSQAELRRIRRQ